MRRGFFAATFRILGVAVVAAPSCGDDGGTPEGAERSGPGAGGGSKVQKAGAVPEVSGGAEAEGPKAVMGDAWSNATLGVERSAEAGAEGAEVEFRCEWAEGESCGTVYPKVFVEEETGERAPFEALWDHGGKLPCGTYDVRIDIDGPPSSRIGEARIRHLALTAPGAYDVTIDLHAAQLALPLETYRSVRVFPAGTHAEHEPGSVPEALEIGRYDQYHKKGVMPSGTFDLLVEREGAEAAWRPGYTLPAGGEVKSLED